jgi:hypothetical protein
MEIYYCQLCGTKIDSDALTSGDAVRRGSDEVYCRACAPKAPPKIPTAGPVKPVTRDHRPIRTPLRPHEKPVHTPRPQAAPVSPKSFAMLVLGLGAAILITGLAVVFKPKPEDKGTEKPPEKVPEKTAENKTPDPPKSAPTIEKPTAAEVEKSADTLYAQITKAAGAKSAKDNIDAYNNFLEHYPASTLVPRARVELSRLKKVQKAMTDGAVTVGTFESDEEWGFHDGGEFPGAKGSKAFETSDKKEGAQALKLSGDFTGGGAYVSIGRTFSGGVNETLTGIPFSRVAGLRVWIRSPVAGAMSLRASDNADQCHQQTVSFTPKDEWQQVEFKSLNSGQRYSHWGGKNDGSFTWPLRGVAFMLTSEGVGPTKKAEILIDQVEVVLKPEK